MSRIQFLSILAIGATLLGGCDGLGRRQQGPVMEPARVAGASTQAGAATERAQSIRWDENTQEFEFAGKPLKAAKLWTFDRSTDGFSMTGGQALLTSHSGLSVTQDAPDPILRSPQGLDVDGAQNTLVLVRLTRAAPGQAWAGDVHYTTASHGESAKYVALPIQGEDPAVNETTILVYDMANLKKGGQDWIHSVIDQVRFDFEDQPGGEFLVRQVAIANNPDPAAIARLRR